MIDLLFQIGLSNALIAMLLALLAMVVGANSQRPQIAYLLWMLVLIKLVTPPIFNLPVELPAVFSANGSSELSTAGELDFRPIPVLDVAVNSDVALDTPQMNSPAHNTFAARWNFLKPWLGLLWLVGTSLIVAVSLVRVARFQRLLSASLQQPDKGTKQVAKKIGRRLGLRKSPEILTTSAGLCPMVWWIGGRAKVILPQSLFAEMQQTQWQWVLAHELAHVRRRDYLVRWLEWLACACFWWNPVVWFAQRNLRAAEEICCDELVLSSLNPGAHTYAESIFRAVESLVRPAIRPPAMASEINSGGLLERRIEMILSANSEGKSPRCWQLGLIPAAMLLIPLGFVTAQDFDAVEKRLVTAVAQDELSLEQAAIMMKALREAAEDDEREYEEREHAEHEHGEHQHAEHEHAEHEHAEHEHAEHEHAEHEHYVHEHGKDELGKHELGKHEHAEWNEREKKDKYHAIEAEIMMAYRAGELSREEVGKKLAAVKKRLWAEAADEHGERERALRRALAETKQAVESGRIAPADAKKRIAEIKARMGFAGSERDDERKQEYIAVEKELAELVKAGRINKEQARERLEGLQKQLWADRDNEEREREFHAVETEIEALIDSGKITKEQGLERLQGYRAGLWPERDKDRERAARAELAAMRGIGAAVESGEMSAEEAGRALKGLRKRMASAKSRDDRDREQRMRYKEQATDYKAAVAELKQLTKSGKITEKQAKERLQAMKRRMEAVKEKDRDENSIDEDDERTDRSEGTKLLIEQELLNLEIAKMELIQRLGPNHPQIQALNAQIELWSKERD